MAIIFETKNFIVDSQEKPFVSRTDGGHIRVKAKDISITNRTKIKTKQAIKLMRLTIIAGDLLEKAMNKQGIPDVQINYQENGNWAFKDQQLPHLHIHIFGRSRD